MLTSHEVPNRSTHIPNSSPHGWVASSTVTVPPGFDSSRIRLTGNVAGQPPYKGSLKHHGWVAAQVKFPTLSDAIDYRVVAPAEVEL